ncbi:hypothetical protein [Fimbriiglobus ruber]|uniref:Uncharacterized protein n=1 Tax=Fimbriiglobus ruber TaxID=1908690 RepID=A0A225DLQ3_9BACT|nr:hypothetical protein [Fimbriiglobus ruber]OWK39478.1 hypothetical protein FRUB_06041 [Fimbriiglobus ruber]
MIEKVYVVGAYVSNEDPLLRVHAFIPLVTEHKTLEEAVAAVEADYRKSHAPSDITFVVYRSEKGDAIVEVNRGGPFNDDGFYKVALIEVERVE